MSKGKKLNPILLLVIVVLLFLVGIGGYYLGITNGNFTQSINLSKNSQSSNLAVFNLSGVLKYFSSQISAPSNYFATDDNMIDSYITQGGMAPPRIILMKGYQVNKSAEGGYIEYFPAIHQTKNDCIVIWSTNGFGSIDDWNNSVTDLKGTLTDHQEMTIGTRTAEMYKMVRNEGDIYVALLPIGNSEGTSYYFHTCNTNNKPDFISTVQSIKFRDDVYH